MHDAGVPCVNLTLEVEGMANLSMENDNGITLLINHLVEKHGAKTINFISGPEGNSDGEGRLNAYKKALEEHGMEIEDHRIYFGDYHPKSGMEAVEFFADSGLDMPCLLYTSPVCDLRTQYGFLYHQKLSVPLRDRNSGSDYLWYRFPAEGSGEALSDDRTCTASFPRSRSCGEGNR